jgi:hypothetical protein
VWEGKWKGNISVALKMLENEDKEFDQEVGVLSSLRHVRLAIYYF